MPEHYDVIVVGSGAGGGTLAHAPAPTGHRILILERGDFIRREKQNWDGQEVWVKHRYRNRGEWTDRDGKAFLPKQHYCVGGNTKMYGAVLFRKRERDFGEIHHVDGVSQAWPITYADLEPYYTRAEQLYHVHGERKRDPLAPPTTSPYPHPAMSHEPRVEQLTADLEGAGLHPFPLPLGIMIDEDDPVHSPCTAATLATASRACCTPRPTRGWCAWSLRSRIPTSRCAPMRMSAGWRPPPTVAA